MKKLFTLIFITPLFILSCMAQGTEAVVGPKLKTGQAVATFAGGCFWCTEAVFERVVGVDDVYSGYIGGTEQNPTYKQVSYGETSHAEAIQIIYNTELVSYKELLDIFFLTHDPTQLNRQGPDVGEQYRSAVFYHSQEQKETALKAIKDLTANQVYQDEIVTEIKPYGVFWMAEDYHQDYYELNRGNPYILGIAVPKVKKLFKLFPNQIKEQYQTEK